MSEPIEQQWLTVAQVAALFQVHDETVRRWIRDGQVPVLNLGKKAGYRMRPQDLDQFIAQRFGAVGKPAASGLSRRR
jgi:excisionase family DNA binding protein